MGWLPNWAKRRALTIEAGTIGGDVQDFPVRIYLNVTAGVTWADVTDIFSELGADGWNKIAFTGADGETQLYYEKVVWDAEAEQAIFYVKVPEVEAGNDTTVFLYYDGTKPDNSAYGGATGSAAASQVWDSGFACVYHCEDIPGGAGSVKDSTAYGNDLTPYGGMSQDDLIPDYLDLGGHGYDLDADDSLLAAANNSYKATELTLEFWGSRADWTPSFDAWAIYCYQNFYIGANSGGIRFYKYDSKRMTYESITGDSSGLGAGWHHIAGRQDNSLEADHQAIFIDGELVAAESGAVQESTISKPLSIGCYYNGTSRFSYWNSYLDEIRISRVVRSDAWIGASYKSHTDELVSFGAVELNTALAVLVEGPAEPASLLLPVSGWLTLEGLTIEWGVDSPATRFGLMAFNPNEDLITIAPGFFEGWLRVNGPVGELMPFFEGVPHSEVTGLGPSWRAIWAPEIAVTWVQYVGFISHPERGEYVFEASSAQVRRTDGKESYLSLTVALTAESIPEITCRRSGGWVGIRKIYGAPGARMQEEVLRVPIESLRLDLGARRESATLYGYLVEEFAPKSKVLVPARIDWQANGKRRYYIPGVEADIEPGDTVDLLGESIEVGAVEMLISPSRAEMQLTEAA